MIHGEFALDGYRFGEGHRVYAAAVTLGGIEWRVQDQTNPVGHTLIFGRDYLDPQPATLELTIDGGTPEDARELYRGLSGAWLGARELPPGREQVLAFGVHGDVRRIYGRTRSLSVPTTDLYVLPTARAEAIFQASDSLVYDDVAREETLTVLPGSAGGFVFPVTFPWSTVTGGTRQGVIADGGGQVPTPDVEITITGPVARPAVAGSGWRVELATSLAWDEQVTIYARRRMVLRPSGASAAGVLTRASRLADITIPPGPSELSFTGTDSSGTATARVRWRPAYTSI